MARPKRDGPKSPPGPRPKGYDEFVQLHEAGLSPLQIAERLQISKRTAYRYLSLYRTEQNSSVAVTGPARRHAADTHKAAAAATVHLEPGELPPDPGDGFDAISLARRVACDPRQKIDVRLRAISVCEARRQFDITHNVHGTARVDWSKIKREDIPPDERFRLAGLLAEDLVKAREPGLSTPGTTEAQALVFYELGQMVGEAEAEAVAAELRAGRQRALDRLAVLVATAKPPAEVVIMPNPNDYLDA